MDRYTLLYLNWVTNGHLLCFTGNSAQRLWQSGRERTLGKSEHTYVCGSVPLSISSTSV